MKLHASAINKIVHLSHLYGGSTDEAKLRAFLNQLDFTPYERRTTENQEIILVLTEDFTKELNRR